jgi:hypothetical protein
VNAEVVADQDVPVQAVSRVLVVRQADFREL